jgi:hypothetical protein
MEILKIGELINKPNRVLNVGETSLPFYVFGENIDENLYEDITSNENWMSIGLHEYDYLFCRQQVRLRGEILDYNDPSNIDELRCASQYFCVIKTLRDLVHSEEEQIEYWSELILKTQKTRHQRWVKAKSYISYILHPLDSSNLAIETEALSTKFIEYGIESLVLNGVLGLYDWLETTYTEKSYYNANDRDVLLRILKTGK